MRLDERLGWWRLKVSLRWNRRFGLNVWLLMANTFFVFTGMGIFVLIFNLYLASLGFREDYIGLFAFANTAAIGGFAIPAGALSNRFGPGACLAGASILMGVAAAAVGLVDDPVLIVVGGVVLGISNALIFVPSSPFLMDNSDDDERLWVFSANFAVMSVASVLGSLASGYLPSVFAALGGLEAAQSTPVYRLTLVTGAFVCLLGAAPMVFVRANQRRVPDGRRPAPAVMALGEAEARRAIVAFSVAVVLIAFATGLILPFFNVYFAEHLAASVEEIGIIYAAASLLMVPCSLLGPAVSRRFGTVSGIAIARALTIPFIISLAVVPSIGLGAVVYVARAALMSVTWPLDNAFAMELMPPRARAIQAGVRSASWNVGWAVASLVAGQLIVLVGYPAVFVASGLLTLAGTIYHYGAFREYQTRPAGAAARVAES